MACFTTLGQIACMTWRAFLVAAVVSVGVAVWCFSGSIRGSIGAMAMTCCPALIAIAVARNLDFELYQSQQRVRELEKTLAYYEKRDTKWLFGPSR